MNGPFQSQPFSTLIGNFMMKELFPVTKNIRKLAIDVSGFRADFKETILQKKMKILESSYKEVSISLITIYNKWTTPDILFKDLNIDSNDHSQFGPLMGDYFNNQQAVMVHFNEAFRLLNYIDDILTGQKTAIYNRITIIIAILAVAVSLITAILKK